MKWYGTIGFVETVETQPGEWTEEVIEREYFGEVLRSYQGIQTADKLNDDITISNRISIVSSPYTEQHLHSIRYVVFKGVRWKVSSIEDLPPRIILSLGGVYNG